MRFNYTCRTCGGVSRRPSRHDCAGSRAAIPKSNASPSLVACIAKFVDGVLLYRQESMFARIGVELVATPFIRRGHSRKRSPRQSQTRRH